MTQTATIDPAFGRTVDEITTHIEQVAAESLDDFFGVITVDLAEVLPKDSAVRFVRLKDPDAEWVPHTRDQVHAEAVSYLSFAVGKAADHRGLSANRSVNHYQAWIWLLFGDDALAELNAQPYANYGAPQLRWAAEKLAPGWWENNAPGSVKRMADGLPCEPGCSEGCGS